MRPMTPRYVTTCIAVAVTLLVGGWIVATRSQVPTWEIDVTSAMNEAPGWIAAGLWPLMQFGSLGGPALVALGAWVWKRSLPLSGAILASGLLAWSVAKLIKQTVERGRPLEYIATITIHEGDGTGFGFVSGHTAVAFGCAAAIAPDLSARGRYVAFALASIVGVSRIVYGVHFPADVLGGAAVGLLCALVARAVVGWCVGRLAASRATADVSDARVAPDVSGPEAAPPAS